MYYDKNENFNDPKILIDFSCLSIGQTLIEHSELFYNRFTNGAFHEMWENDDNGKIIIVDVSNKHFRDKKNHYKIESPVDISKVDFPVDTGLWITQKIGDSYYSRHYTNNYICDEIATWVSERYIVDSYAKYMRENFSDISDFCWTDNFGEKETEVFIWIEYFNKYYTFRYGTEERFKTSLRKYEGFPGTILGEVYSYRFQEPDLQREE